MGNFWALIQVIKKIFDFIGVMMGIIERTKYEKVIKDVNENTEKAGNPDLSEQERSEAAKRLEDIANRRS